MAMRPGTRLLAWIMLGLLCLAYVFSMLDRVILSLLVEPLKRDLGLTDLEVSYLQGFAFIIMYSLAGLPMGYIVDRWPRIRLVAIGISLWSLMTAACGLASRYVTLFLGRIGVGIGEATLGPAAYSLIRDSFPERRLGLAMGIYSMGGALGAGLALVVGGYLIQWMDVIAPLRLPFIGVLQAWQLTFLFVGLPGLVVALLIACVPEPARSDRSPSRTFSSVSRELRAFLSANRRTLLCHHLAVGFSNVVCYGAVAWVASFFIRVHGWPIGRIGLFAGVANIVGGLIGMVGAGFVSDRLRARGAHVRLTICMCAALLGAMAAGAFALVNSPVAAAVFFCMIMACALVPVGVAGAALQEITPSHLVGFTSALYLFAISMIGSVGPSAIAFLGQSFFSGQDAIRYALALALPVSFMLSAALFYASIQPYRRSVVSSAGTVAVALG
ncbi:MAG TPA: MFS transporter [Steroidobacter sp.]|uniref:MFS transporter n=1 Tax=Steroidobacter sp. TaxID=1978227 RepID=UPI002ED95E08